MDYHIIYTTDAIREYIGDAGIIAFDFETSPDDAWRDEPKAALDAHKAHIVGISLSVSEGSAVYIPLAHKVGDNAANPASVIEHLREAVFENPKVMKVAHNLSFEAMFLYALGIVVCEPCYDTIAAAQLTLKSKFEFRNLSDSGLKLLSTSLFGANMPDFNTVTAGRHFDEMDPEDDETLRYACADSDYTLRLYHKFNGWFDKNLPSHRNLVEQVESPTAVYCGMMKYNGVPMNAAAMLERQKEAEEKIVSLRAEIDEMTGGVDIGANASTSAFKQYLYKDLGLPVLKTTEKHQEAADDATMILLAEYCQEKRPELVRLFELVQEYRRWGKLKSTYIDGYMTHINAATGRIHPDLMPLGTETGRFASRNPNLQNCFDEKTEILTMRGFVPFPELTSRDSVAQWQAGEIDFVSPLEIIVQQYEGEMVCLKNQHIDLFMTPDHRCLLQNRKTRQFFIVPASEYAVDCRQLHAGQYRFGNRHLKSAEITLLAAAQADGYYHDGGIDFTFEKARKYRRLLQALLELNVPFSDRVRKDGKVTLRLKKSPFCAWVMRTLGEEKMWGKWLLDYDQQTVNGLLSEILHWDGCFTRSNHYRSSIKQNADWMQILYVLTGRRANLRQYHNGNPNSAVNYQLDVTDRNYSLTSNIEKDTVAFSGKVYCVSVSSGFIVIRRNGRVCITSNCPRKDNDPVGVRKFIAAPEGSLLISLDFSQIELRVGAFYCRDEKMLETYRGGGDIHAQTTSVIFKIPFETAVDKNAPHYKERRTIAKNCNFGVFYGLFAAGLQRTLRFKAGLDVSKQECETIIEQLKSGYPRLAEWQDRFKRRAASTYFSETWLGRRRYLIGILSSDWGTRSFAERCAMNTPIQGTAADILKLAMGRIVAGMKKRPWLKPFLQIHDELVFEIPADKLDEAVTFIKVCMEAQPFPEFDVPIIAEAAYGANFGELKEMG